MECVKSEIEELEDFVTKCNVAKEASLHEDRAQYVNKQGCYIWVSSHYTVFSICFYSNGEVVYFER